MRGAAKLMRACERKGADLPAESIPRDWDSMSIDALCELLDSKRPTPQVTIEAILYCVRECGLGALKEPANVERLLRCDEAAKAQINARIARLIERKGAARP